MTANQMYKQSGSGLPFKEWIKREKAKGILIPQKGVTDEYNEAVGNLETEEIKNEKKKSKTVVGLSKPILIISVLMIVGAIGYTYYRKNKWGLA